MHGSIRSIWAIELLLVLRRDRNASWSPDELVRELRGSAGLVHEILEWFSAAGIAQSRSPTEFYFEPATPLIGRLCDELEQEYRRRPIAVMNAIVSAQPSNLRALADAFRFREKRDDEC
jgi:hypothetical protein